MVDPKEMTGEELLARLDHLNQSLHAYDGSAACAPNVLLDERHDIKDEIKARLDELKESIAAHDEAKRRKTVQSFSFAAGVAINGLWKAHGGRELTQAESMELGRLLHGFFVDIRPTEEGG